MRDVHSRRRSFSQATGRFLRRFLHRAAAAPPRRCATAPRKAIRSFIFATLALTLVGTLHAGWTVVYLQPAGATDSAASGLSATNQSGVATIGGVTHAALWTGTAASFVDLHPAGATSSEISATTGTRQAGSANFGGVNHVGIWTSTAASFRRDHCRRCFLRGQQRHRVQRQPG